MSTVILFTLSYVVCFAVRRVGNVSTLRMCLRVVCAEYNLWLLSSCTFLTPKKYWNSAEVIVNLKKPKKTGFTLQLAYVSVRKAFGRRYITL